MSKSHRGLIAPENQELLSVPFPVSSFATFWDYEVCGVKAQTRKLTLVSVA